MGRPHYAGDDDLWFRGPAWPAPRIRRRLDALEPDRRQPVRQRPALVQFGRDPRAAVLVIDVDQRNPQRQALLRLDEGVAVVLVPGELLRLARLLVDRLVPIEP